MLNENHEVALILFKYDFLGWYQHEFFNASINLEAEQNYIQWHIFLCPDFSNSHLFFVQKRLKPWPSQCIIIPSLKALSVCVWWSMGFVLHNISWCLKMILEEWERFQQDINSSRAENPPAVSSHCIERWVKWMLHSTVEETLVWRKHL